MGEYADMAIDDMLAIDEYSLDGMGDYWSPFYNVGRFTRQGPKSKTCKNCGKTGLYWKADENGRWYLEEYNRYSTSFGDDGFWARHKCSQSIKGAFNAMKDPSKEYFKYLDSVPAMTEEDYERGFY